MAGRRDVQPHLLRPSAEANNVIHDVKQRIGQAKIKGVISYIPKVFPDEEREDIISELETLERRINDVRPRLKDDKTIFQKTRDVLSYELIQALRKVKDAQTRVDLALSYPQGKVLSLKPRRTELATPVIPPPAQFSKGDLIDKADKLMLQIPNDIWRQAGVGWVPKISQMDTEDDLMDDLRSSDARLMKLISEVERLQEGQPGYVYKDNTLQRLKLYLADVREAIRNLPQAWEQYKLDNPKEFAGERVLAKAARPANPVRAEPLLNIPEVATSVPVAASSEAYAAAPRPKRVSKTGKKLGRPLGSGKPKAYKPPKPVYQLTPEQERIMEINKFKRVRYLANKSIRNYLFATKEPKSGQKGGQEEYLKQMLANPMVGVARVIRDPSTGRFVPFRYRNEVVYKRGGIVSK